MQAATLFFCVSEGNDSSFVVLCNGVFKINAKSKPRRQSLSAHSRTLQGNKKNTIMSFICAVKCFALHRSVNKRKPCTSASQNEMCLIRTMQMACVAKCFANGCSLLINNTDDIVSSQQEGHQFESDTQLEFFFCLFCIWEDFSPTVHGGEHLFDKSAQLFSDVSRRNTADSIKLRETQFGFFVRKCPLLLLNPM